MKRLFIRYFEKQEDKIPVDSTFVCGIHEDTATIDNTIEKHIGDITNWIKHRPAGKVDFVWL